MVMRGAPWGAGTGRKLAKYQVLIKVVVKKDGIRVPSLDHVVSPRALSEEDSVVKGSSFEVAHHLQ